MLMEILSGVFSGANFGGDVPDQYTVMDRSQECRAFFYGDETRYICDGTRLS